MTFWIGVLAGATAANGFGILFHHLWEAGRHREDRAARDVMVKAFTDFERIARGIVNHRVGSEQEHMKKLGNLEERVTKLEKWAEDDPRWDRTD